MRSGLLFRPLLVLGLARGWPLLQAVSREGPWRSPAKSRSACPKGVWWSGDPASRTLSPDPLYALNASNHAPTLFFTARFHCPLRVAETDRGSQVECPPSQAAMQLARGLSSPPDFKYLSRPLLAGNEMGKFSLHPRPTSSSTRLSRYDIAHLDNPAILASNHQHLIFLFSVSLIS